MKVKRPTEDKTHFQITKWLEVPNFDQVTAALDEGDIKWRLKDLGKKVEKRYSIWREKVGFVREIERTR